MKRSLKYLVINFSLIALLTSCASYNAVSLRSLSPLIIDSGNDAGREDVVVVAKAFDLSECKEYLDRDVLSAGYQPIQLYIQNNSSKPYIFSPERVSLSCATAKEVGDMVHTSTAARVAGYAAGALFVWPLVIPAVVDGIMSAEANDALDKDFYSKVAGNQTIFPHSYFNKIIFVPSNQFESKFSITLIDAQSNQPKLFSVIAY